MSALTLGGLGAAIQYWGVLLAAKPLGSYWHHINLTSWPLRAFPCSPPSNIMKSSALCFKRHLLLRKLQETTSLGAEETLAHGPHWPIKRNVYFAIIQYRAFEAEGWNLSLWGSHSIRLQRPGERHSVQMRVSTSRSHSTFHTTSWWLYSPRILPSCPSFTSWWFGCWFASKQHANPQARNLPLWSHPICTHPIQAFTVPRMRFSSARMRASR